MDRERNQRIAALFERALDLATAEQVSLLDRECTDDAERAAVERLLEAEKELQAQERAGAPSSFRLPLSASMLMMPTAPPVAAAGGGSTGGGPTSDTAAAGTPPGNSDPASATGVTAAPRAAPPRSKPRPCVIDVGAVIGRYRVVERIGEGGMGIVFAARHEDLGHGAVVKVLHHEMTHSDQAVQRFMDEARIAAGIRHPGVVQVIDVGRHESGALFILMERLYGENLQQRLKRKGKLPPRVAIGFALQTARALGAVHAQGVVHRDLKPENLYLVADPEVPGGERVKILDFGIAKLHSRPSGLTQSQVTMGTPPYMAPEQCMSAARVDSRADLYSLGVLLFEMLCGRLPFRCKSAPAYIIAHVQKPPPSVQRFTRVSPALAHLVARLLAKRPEERFASADALIRALDRVPELLDGWEPDGHSERMTDGETEAGSDGVDASGETRPGTPHGLRATPSRQPATMRGQPGARPSGRHGRTPGMPLAHTDPEAGETSRAMFVAFGNTRPEPVDEPEATSPVVIEEVAPIAPAMRASRPPTEPGSTVDTLGSAPGEAAPAGQGNNPARRSRVAATLRWVYGLVPAGGLTLLLMAVAIPPVVTMVQDVDWRKLVSALTGGRRESAEGDMRQMRIEAELIEHQTQIRTALTQLFDGGSEQVQEELIAAIHDTGTPEAAWLLDRALASTPDIRRASSHVLCALGWRDRADELRDAMRRSGGSLRARLAADLLCLGDRDAITMLEDALDDEAIIRQVAAEALARAGQRELARPVLARALADSEEGSEPWLRAARGLLWLDDADARAALGRELARPEPERALAAAEILAGAGDRAGLDHLDRVLADSKFTHRAEAALALARNLDDGGAERFADRLVAFARHGLDSRHPHERRAAAAVMGRLAGQGGYLDAAELAALRPRLEALRDDSTPDAEERAVRITARVALLAVYRALSARKHHE